MVHHITAKFLVVHVEICMHKLNGTHLFHIVDSRLLQDLEVGDDLPWRWGKAYFIGSTAKAGINFSDHGIIGTDNVVGI